MCAIVSVYCNPFYNGLFCGMQGSMTSAIPGESDHRCYQISSSPITEAQTHTNVCLHRDRQSEVLSVANG